MTVNIPVLMYHGIGNDPRNVPYGHLLQPVEQFERCIRWLAKNKFTTITLQELYDHRQFGAPVPRKPIVLTFDDGYLDNWVYVYPILQHHAMNGTLFVNPEFLDPRAHCRPYLSDVSARGIANERLNWAGYLSWNELQEMERSGVMDVQSHTMTHTYYFRSKNIIDFHHPEDSYAWLAWNEFPERKYKWIDENQRELVPYGTPVYEYGRSLGIRRYFDDAHLRKYLVQFVEEHGNRRFFRQLGWREILWRRVEEYKRTYPDEGRYETNEEYEQRVYTEIVGSKHMLETHLRKKIHFLCWPGGAHTEQALDLAIRAGYLSTTKGTQKNRAGTDPTKLNRVAAYLDNEKFGALVLKFFSLRFFVAVVKNYRDEGYCGLLLRAAAIVVRMTRCLAAFKRAGPIQPRTSSGENLVI